MVAMTLGVIEAVDAVYQGQSQTGGALLASSEISMVRGAIMGALIAGLGFLALQSFLRRGAITYSAALMLGTAAVLEVFWLGFLPVPHMNVFVLLQGLFGASVIIFLSTSIALARRNAGLGGIMFAASLVFVGIGIINFLGRADFASAMVRALVGVSGFAVALATYQAMKGDLGARMILPGAILVALGTLSFISGFGGAVWGHGLLTAGLIVASLVTLTEKPARQLAEDFGKASPLSKPSGQLLKTRTDKPAHAQNEADVHFFGTPSPDEEGLQPQDIMAQNYARASKGRAGDQRAGAPEVQAGRKPAISGQRLVEVLDFSGIGVWDWSLDGVYQSESLCEMLGADCNADFTPEALRAFVMPSHLGLFEAEVLGHGTGDGGFDTQIVLHNGATMRLRGARAVDSSGRLERVVALFEKPVDPPVVEKPVTAEMTGSDHAHAVKALSPLNAGGAAGAVGAAQQNATPADDQQPVPTVSEAISLDAMSSQLSSQTPGATAAAPFVAFTAMPVHALGSGEVIGFDLQLDAFALGAGTVKGSLDWGDRAVIDTTLDQAAQFLADRHQDARRAGATTRLASDAFVALTVSYADLAEPGRVDQLRDAILGSDLAYGSLVLAMTGLDRVQDMAAAKAQLAILRQAGARLAFSDGNAGRNSFGMVHRFDFDMIALDPALTARMGKDREARETVKALAALGRDLGLRVVAIGIDDDDQQAALSDIGCTFAAGACIAPSIALAPPAAVTAMARTFAEAPAEGPSEKSEDGISLDSVSALSFPARSPDPVAASPVPAASASAAAAPETEVVTPIHNIEAAFAKTVPTFDSAPDTALPKWRTWVKNMR